MGKTIGNILTNADTAIASLSVGMIVIGGAIVIWDKAVRVLAHDITSVMKAIRKKGAKKDGNRYDG